MNRSVQQKLSLKASFCYNRLISKEMYAIGVNDMLRYKRESVITEWVITKWVITKCVITKWVITKWVITKWVITKCVITSEL